MSVRFSLICVAAAVMVNGSASSAQAQVVSVTSSGYAANNPPAQPPTIAPYGTFSIPPNKAGKWRVAVDYGTIVNGTFGAYNPVPNGVPGLSYSATQNVGANGGNFNWSIASADASGVDSKTQMRARLQYSVDNGVTWNIQGNETLVAAIAVAVPPGKD